MRISDDGGEGGLGEGARTEQAGVHAGRAHAIHACMDGGGRARPSSDLVLILGMLVEERRRHSRRLREQGEEKKGRRRHGQHVPNEEGGQIRKVAPRQRPRRENKHAVGRRPTQRREYGESDKNLQKGD